MNHVKKYYLPFKCTEKASTLYWIHGVLEPRSENTWMNNHWIFTILPFRRTILISPISNWFLVKKKSKVYFTNFLWLTIDTTRCTNFQHTNQKKSATRSSENSTESQRFALFTPRPPSSSLSPTSTRKNSLRKTHVCSRAKTAPYRRLTVQVINKDGKKEKSAPREKRRFIRTSLGSHADAGTAHLVVVVVAA